MDYKTLKEEVNKIKGVSFASIDTLTDVKLSGGKKNPLQGRVTKTTTGANIMIFSGTDQNGYENMVKRRMIEEGKDPNSFSVGKRAWGIREGQSPFIAHNDKHYLECVFISPGKSAYFVDNVETDKAEIEGLPAHNEEPKTEAAEKAQGGIDNKVIIRTYSLDSIVAIRLKGVELRG